MRVLVATVRELVGLFVDDGSLALYLVLVVVLAGAGAALVPGQPLIAGAILLFGALGVLLVNVLRAGRR